MRNIQKNSAVLGILLLIGCAGQIQTSTTYDDSADFAGYRTFAQAPPPRYATDLPRYNEVIGGRIQQRIASNLEGKGLEPTAWDEADLQVSFTIGGQERQDFEYWDELDWSGPGEARPEDYVAGSLVIDMADRVKQRLVWHGYGNENLFSQTASDATFKQAVDAVLAKYPPAAAASSK